MSSELDKLEAQGETPRTDKLRSQLTVFLTGTSGEPISAKEVDRQWSRHWEGAMYDFERLERELAQMAREKDAAEARAKNAEKFSEQCNLSSVKAMRRVSELEAKLAEAGREGFYERLWKDFVSIQRGDAQGICEKVERYYREQDATLAAERKESGNG